MLRNRMDNTDERVRNAAEACSKAFHALALTADEAAHNLNEGLKGVGNAMQYLLKGKDCYLRHAREFENTFGVKLITFWSHDTGFDVIKFDEWLVVGDNESTKDKVLREYGKRAVTLITLLINKM